MIIRVENLSKSFKLKAGLFTSGKSRVYAVDDVSLSVKKGESFGIVGESGSGKSTLARLIAGAYKIDSGRLEFNLTEKNFLFDSETRLSKFRKESGNRVKYIFQDPASSLNPRMSIEEILFSGYKYSGQWKGREEARKKAEKIFSLIGMASNIFDKRPSDFSGGQRQRISIARALMFDPEILICDEIVSALDLSIQSQILNLIADLKQELSLTLLFISHDLSVVSYICDTIAVMYGGIILELGSSEQISTKPLHPYTQFLYSSMPGRTPLFTETSNQGLSQLEKLHSCPYFNRCPYADNKCRTEKPQLKKVSDGREVACWRV
ncbi:MAG: ABC transporter ATP-binding protein [Spirochaetales bacterium]|nr:ABC transporter ATP-binding protein [Spirochaetales bacterium]